MALELLEVMYALLEEIVEEQQKQAGHKHTK